VEVDMPATRSVLGSIVLSWMLVALAGCSNGGAYDSGVDDSRPFDMLTDAEARTACENLAAHIERNISDARQLELTCTVQALGATATPADCRASVTTCLAGAPEPFLGDLGCADAMAATDCSSPVGEVEQCINADLNAVFDRLDRISCDIAGDLEALQELQMSPPPSTECTSLAAECPQLADGFLG